MMFILYTNTVSPHQIPVCKEIVRLLGSDNVLYCYEDVESKGRAALGWSQKIEPWCRRISESTAEIESCDVLLIDGLRPIALMQRRLNSGKVTLYMSERWFKPPIGMFRLLHPRYFRMARAFVRLLSLENGIRYLPIGIHAARDMARLCGLMHGDWKCLFRAPKLDFEKKPGGRVFLSDDKGINAKKYCLDKMRLWGYYVEPSKKDALQGQKATETNLDEIKVLWVGRLLDLKRVDVIVRAISEHADLKSVDVSLPKITLDIYGTGPEEKRLKKLASKYRDLIRFYPPVPITEVRKLMQEHDVYVLASNAYEGWGAVVSEALEEGMKVIGTYEAGSSGTILPESSLFRAGDWRKLREILLAADFNGGIGEWKARNAAEFLVEYVKQSQYSKLS